MIPLRDLLPTMETPVATRIIVALNVLVFAFAVTVANLETAARSFGAVAYELTGMRPADPRLAAELRAADGAPAPFRVLSHMWLHAGLLHLLGNMWFLWLFGDNVEDRLGRVRFVALYLASGLVALGAQLVAAPASPLPMIGASGAVAGILGAYLRFFPNARVLTLVPVGFLPFVFAWPAKVFLGLWIGLQVLNGLLVDAQSGGVAWWAHIGGFVLGFAVAPVLWDGRRARYPASLRRREPRPRPGRTVPWP